MKFQMLTNASSVGPGAWFNPLSRGGRGKATTGVVEVSLGSGTIAAVTLEGRADESAEPIIIQTWDGGADGVQAIQLMYQMRFNVTSPGTTINAWMNI